MSPDGDGIENGGGNFGVSSFINRIKGKRKAKASLAKGRGTAARRWRDFSGVLGIERDRGLPLRRIPQSASG